MCYAHKWVDQWERRYVGEQLDLLCVFLFCFLLGSMVGDDGADFKSTGFSEI